MGACLSFAAGGTKSVLEAHDGSQEDFDARFTTSQVLGEGEFGQVKLVVDSKNQTSYACKTLRKGAVLKDNCLYPPLPPGTLRGEVEMLQKLKGEHYCLKLVAVYETPRAVLVVTDCCLGGEMMEYVVKQKEDLRTEDVSRIAFQLLSAVDHCAKHDILHRDIKPENAMFLSEDPGAELRLIDFGSGTSKVVDGMHTTFAGTPFYNSPEMFQNTYTSKTDVWSAGVVLYVLVAGYPAECLQKAFNSLLNAKRTSIKDVKLPNMPEDMPDSYFELLDELLVYRQKQRKSANQILEECDFVKFHHDIEHHENDKVAELPLAPCSKRQARLSKTASVALRGSILRHSRVLDFKKMERSLTTLLATLLSKPELLKLLAIFQERFGNSEENGNPQLQIVMVKELKDILKLEMGNNQACWSAVEKLADSSYDSFAYHTFRLAEFAPRMEEESFTPTPEQPLPKMRRSTSVWQVDNKELKKAASAITNTTDRSGKSGSKKMRRAASCYVG